MSAVDSRHLSSQKVEILSGLNWQLAMRWQHVPHPEESGRRDRSRLVPRTTHGGTEWSRQRMAASSSRLN